MNYQAKEPEDKFQKFQKSKEEGMAIMAANRDATMIVCEILKFESSDMDRDDKWTDEEIKNEIKKWRKFFYVEIYDTTPDEQLKQDAKTALNSIPF